MFQGLMGVVECLVVCLIPSQKVRGSIPVLPQ